MAPASFDVVTMWHSIEHVHDPLAILRAAWEVLVPGGKLVVACPNVESWAFRAFGPAWFGLDLPRHLTRFSPHTLRTALTAAGFRVETVRPIRHSDWLRSAASWPSGRGRPGGGGALEAAGQADGRGQLHLARGSDCMMAVAERPDGPVRWWRYTRFGVR
ncbi:MAG: class I SAM-dependent methyltransferase [Gemmataceae bacterium]